MGGKGISHERFSFLVSRRNAVFKGYFRNQGIYFYSHRNHKMVQFLFLGAG